jgi:hypothetical protein
MLLGWRFSLFSLFSQEIYSERPLVRLGNPGLSRARAPKQQRNRPLFFCCFPLFLFEAQHVKNGFACYATPLCYRTIPAISYHKRQSLSI